MNSLYCFLATEGLIFLKRGYLPFLTPAQLAEPWLQSDCVYKAENSVEVSAQDFRQYLKQQYQNLPANLKGMVTFDYFVQQSEGKRSQIEQSLTAQKQQAQGSQPLSPDRIKNWRALTLYESWKTMDLWQSMAASGQGLVLEFDIASSGFRNGSYNQQAQHLAVINHVPDWLPEDDLYFFFNRPKNDSINQHEWRLIRPLDAADRQIEVKGAVRAMYRLPAKAIKRVILGYRCNPQQCLQVKQYLAQDINYRHVECVQAQLDPKSMSLQLVAIG